MTGAVSRYSLKEEIMNIIKRLFSAEVLIMAAVTVILIVSAFYLFSITASGLSADDDSVWNDYYAPLEADYVAEVRDYLNENGFEDSGVSLTHTTSGGADRAYTLSVHNKRFEKIDEARREEVLELIECMGFADERCTITVRIV